MTSNGQLTFPEIGAQPEALQAAMEELLRQKEWTEKYLNNLHYTEVIFIGSGSSYYQAMSMASTFRKWTGRRASAHPSSEIYLFRDQAVSSGHPVLLVGVSRSGESSEVVLALESVKDLPNWTTCGITCYELSTMGLMTECLLSPLGKEQSTVMTKSFSSMTFMMQAAIAIAAEKQDKLKELNEVLLMDNAVVKSSNHIINELVEAHSFNKYIYLGMGTYNGLAHEGNLKIKEMSCVWTENFGTLEFRHGPKSIVDTGTLICLLVSQHARSYELKVAEEMKAYGAHILLITAVKGADTAFADTVIEIGGANLSDEARSVLYLPALQYLGYYTAMKLNLNPDAPRNLTQVVIL